MKAASLIQEIATHHTPESLVDRLRVMGMPGIVLLRSAYFALPQSRYSFVAAQPFLTVRSFASRCELLTPGSRQVRFGNPWNLLDELMSRYELLDQADLPFPLGGCFGFWGYDLKHFTEPKLPRTAVNDLDLPDCHVGFHDNLVVFDHRIGKQWIVSAGLDLDGARNPARARDRLDFWRRLLEEEPPAAEPAFTNRLGSQHRQPLSLVSNLSRDDYMRLVQRAQAYIWAGDIYQVNLAHRLSAPLPVSSWDLFLRLSAISPAPFSAWLDCGDFQLVSSSPELFLKLSGAHIQTRPIKGTRPRSADPTRDAQWTYELQTSAKEMAELVMITDLLRNDLGRVCQYGTVQVPDLIKLERFPQVQHLVSTVEGLLRPDVTHFAALASSFPGGSITGAPKFRAMEIIDQLEPLTRGPYTGCAGYLGFNRESQLNILIRTALCHGGSCHFHVGAGIVADSEPEAEYHETMAKAEGFSAALTSSLPAIAPRALEPPPPYTADPGTTPQP